MIRAITEGESVTAAKGPFCPEALLADLERVGPSQSLRKTDTNGRSWVNRGAINVKKTLKKKLENVKNVKTWKFFKKSFKIVIKTFIKCNEWRHFAGN